MRVGKYKVTENPGPEPVGFIITGEYWDLRTLVLDAIDACEASHHKDWTKYRLYEKLASDFHELGKTTTR